MRTVALPLLFLALVCSARAQATYTTTANGCGAKNIGYCRVAVASESTSGVVAVTFDNRNLSGRLLLNHADGSYSQYDGKYVGFVSNPDGTMPRITGWVRIRVRIPSNRTVPARKVQSPVSCSSTCTMSARVLDEVLVQW